MNEQTHKLHPELGNTKVKVAPEVLNKLLARLSIARDKLVDRNLRNKLINTNLNSNRSKSIRFNNMSSEKIFNALLNEKKDMHFKSLDETEYQENLLSTEKNNENPEIESNQLYTRLEKETLKKKLKSLYFEAQEYEEEQGVNILYIALGFIKWYENKNSEIERYAPLVLLPVELVRDGAKDKYKIKPREEDLFTNISLKLWLKEQNNIELPEVPDEDPWSIKLYFEQVKVAISKEIRWEVIPNEAVLGFFSFNKFLLWRDLNPESWPEAKGLLLLEHLLGHPIIQNLLIPPLEIQEPDPPIVPNDELIDDYFTPKDLIYVVDADSSQTEAIQRVMTGKNLIIQGPPGTGKSQTITNIIAAAIAQGKKVLFMAEKMAALNVVHERLTKVGLGVMCFELHSRKATKSAVLKQLKDSIEFPGQAEISNRAFQNLIESQNFLNYHSKRVNSARDPWGFSVFEVMGEISKIQRLELDIYSLSIPDSENYTKEKLNGLMIKLVDLTDRLKISGVPSKHPWNLSQADYLNPIEVDRLEFTVNELKSESDSLKEIINSICILSEDAKNFFETAEIKDFKWIGEFSSKLLLAPVVPLCILTSDKLKKTNLIKEIALKIKNYKANKIVVESKLIDSWINYPIEKLRIDLASSGGSIFSIFSKKYRDAVNVLKGLLKIELPKKFNDRLKIIDDALALKNQEVQINEIDKDIKEELSEIWNGVQSDEKLLEELATWFLVFNDANKIEIAFSNLLIKDDRLLNLTNQLSSLIIEYQNKLKNICQIAVIDESEIIKFPFFNIVGITESWCLNIHRFNEWPSVRNYLIEIKSSIGQDAYTKIYEGDIQADHILPVIQVSILEKIWRKIVLSDRDISDVDAFKLDKELEKFRKHDKERLKIAALEVLSYYSKNCPKGNAGEMAVIRQEINKKRNNYPVRKLMKKAGHAIHELKPVFLMSPMSVAQYIEPGSIEFDLILIDEASQVKPEDAIGAISRATQVVVVGDAKQLPPTNFFNRLAEETEIEEENDEDGAYILNDVESILGLCDSVFENNAMLRWHYRSQHPGLIAVSNRNFYDNKLLLPPSVLRSNYSDGLGVSFIKSPPNGYKRGGSEGGRNIIEAELIAKEVILFAKKFPDKSLGVASFSVTQRDAIRDLIDEQRRLNPDVDSFFSTSKEDHFFVKNLESIQGDERDVIFISVGYGRSEDGRLTQTFGPLAAEGGERRLNVLISRAKERCTVFSSITAEDIKSAPGKLGVNAFREFLQFAEKGYFDVPINTDKSFDSGFEESVALFLMQHGYKVQAQVGMAGFFIDIGVINPNNENIFLCGIECDGATYHSSRSARDRDRLRQEILESRGWTIYRIWSTDWFHRRHNQELKLLDHLSNLLNHNEDTDKIKFDSLSKEEDFYEEIPLVPKEELTISKPYIEFDEIYHSQNKAPHQISISERSILIRKIIEIEGPIHQDEIARRVAKAFKLEKAGSRIQGAILEALKFTKNITVQFDFWSIEGKELNWVRNRSNVINKNLERAEYISHHEINVALNHLVKNSVQIDESELVQQVSRLFGFQRCGPELKEVIQSVLRNQLGKTFVKTSQFISLLK